MIQPSLLDGVDRGAAFSPCERYRYRLWRRWKPGRIVTFCMLNPSTATADVDDPTIRRCMGFAQSWGFGSLIIVNMYAWRDTDPKALRLRLDEGIDIVGPTNNISIYDACYAAEIVIAAWGDQSGLPGFKARSENLRGLMGAASRVHHLGLTKEGFPRHPLYLRKDLMATRWE